MKLHTGIICMSCGFISLTELTTGPMCVFDCLIKNSVAIFIDNNHGITNVGRITAPGRLILKKKLCVIIGVVKVATSCELQCLCRLQQKERAMYPTTPNVAAKIN